MIEFRTLGGLDLRDAAGAKVSAVLVHPKRTALLAYLAIAGPRGTHRRDTLLALFWPELDQEHARASLRKAVHHLRRALGKDALVGQGDEELAVADGTLWCDAVAFEQALDDDDVVRAFELYRGPLLKGFFVADAPEFERWLEDARARLRDRAFASVWKLAEREARAHNAFEAAHWARRAAALMPDDEGALRRLVTLLDGVGDRGGAIAAYEEFARRLQQDYDVEPSAESQALIRDVRSRSTTPGAAETPPVTPREPSASQAPSLTSQSAAAIPRPTLSTRIRSNPAAVRRTVGTLAAMLLLVTGWQLWRRVRPVAAAPVSPSAVAVLPFSFRGGAAFTYLGEGIASLLATSLDGAAGLHSVDPASVLAVVSPKEDALDRPSTRALAARVGAGLYILGELIEIDGRLRASATMYDVRNDAEPVARASAEDTSAQLFGIVDRLAAQFLTARDSDADTRLTRVAAVTTHSLPALKAYLDGERYFRIGHYKEAVDAFQRAVAADSTFALAHYRLANAYAWSSDTMTRPAAQQAIRFSQHLSPSDRQLVGAFLPFTTGAADEAERRYREILSTRPFEGEAWYPLGEVLFHFNPVRGRSIAEARPVFQRALAMGPKDAPLTHLLEIEAIQRNYGAFDSLLAEIAPGAHFDLVGRTVRAFVSGTESDRVRVLSEIRGTPDPEIANTARHMLFLLEDREGAERVVRLLLEPSRPREVKALGHILIAHVEIAAGRRRAADTALAAAEKLDRARALEHRGLLHSLPFVFLTKAEREDTRRALAKWNPDSASAPSVVFSGDEQLHRHFRSYLLGILSAALGDHEAALKHAAEVERLPASPNARLLTPALAHGVRSRVAWERGLTERTLSELRGARSERAAADLLGIVPFHSLSHERFLRGEALRALGREEEAHGWFSAFDEHSAFSRAYLAPAHLRAAEIDQRLGRREEAAQHYARFVEMWRDADRELQPLVAAAQARLRELRAEPLRE